MLTPTLKKKLTALHRDFTYDGIWRDGGYPVKNPKAETLFPQTALQTWLKNKHACFDARVFVWDKEFAEAWLTCKNEDWMEWLLTKIVPADQWPKEDDFSLTSAAAFRKKYPYVRFVGSRFYWGKPRERKKKENGVKRSAQKKTRADVPAHHAVRTQSGGSKSAQKRSRNSAANTQGVD